MFVKKELYEVKGRKYMKISEINTESITRGILENYIGGYCYSIKFYGRFNNMLFFMRGDKTNVFDLESNKFVISNKRGIAYPVVDDNKNNYLMIINSYYDDRVYYTENELPRFSDTSRVYMYDMDYKSHDLECYCNIYNENGEKVSPNDKYLTNIYQFNNLLQGDKNYKRIMYRDVDEQHYYGEDVKYDIYPELPSRISDEFKKMESSCSISKAIEEKNKINNKDNFNLDIVYKKGKYSVIDCDNNLIISYDDSIKDVKIIHDNTIMLKNNNGFCALYDINKGYLICFEDKIKFDNVSKLANEVFKLEVEKGYSFLIKDNLYLDVYNDVYMILDNIVVSERFKNIDFYNTDGILLFSIKSRYFYQCAEEIFYYENNKFYYYNFKTGIKKEMDVLSLFKLEDGTELNCSIDEVLKNFTHYYNGEITEKEDFTLFKEKKCGIKIALDVGLPDKMYANKWFSSEEERKKYLQALLDSFMNLSVNNEVDNLECKKKVRKLN